MAQSGLRLKKRVKEEPVKELVVVEDACLEVADLVFEKEINGVRYRIYKNFRRYCPIEKRESSNDFITPLFGFLALFLLASFLSNILRLTKPPLYL